VGRLIPAGTGLAYHRARKAREAAERERAQAISDEEQSLFMEPSEVHATTENGGDLPAV
jgi:DNA-directed RNA polymerase subunit beta'